MSFRLLGTKANFRVCFSLGRKIHCNLNQTTAIFLQENVFENVVYKIAEIVFRPQCDELLTPICC